MKVLVVGDCETGVDALVRRWAGNRAKVFRADWDAMGRAAGPIRNATMAKWAAERCSKFLAFPREGEKNKGTGSCVSELVQWALPGRVWSLNREAT